MSKVYIVNGVEVSYEVFDHTMNGDPDNFSNLYNIDAPDIPQEHKDRYFHDLQNQRAGRGHLSWTPRRRMLDSIAWKSEQLEEKKQKHLKNRQTKIDAWGAQRASNDQWTARIELMHRSEIKRNQNQADEDRKSTRGMFLVLGGGFLFMCMLFILDVYVL